MSTFPQADATADEFRISMGPWFPRNGEFRLAHGHRTYLWLLADFTEITSNELGELKRVGNAIESDNIRWQCFELPKGPNLARTHFQIECMYAGGRKYLNVADRFVLPSRALLDEVDKLASEGSDDEASELLVKANYPVEARNGTQIAKLIDRHSDLVYRLTRTVRKVGRYTDSDYDGSYSRTIKRIYSRWNRIGDSRTPPLSLVVRLADELPKLLENVCTSPRVVLRRQREVETATRIQQVDSACIRWIGRQPGRTLAEKAGPHQRLMGVVRREDYDTPENRVVLDLVRRCKFAGEVYVARHREFKNHKRVRNVRTFVQLCSRLLRDSRIATVGQLVGIAQPNYVLQNESRYSVLWDAYQRLLRQEKVTQSTWAWRDRVWNEWLGFGLCSALARISHRSPAMRDSLLIADEPEAGEYCLAKSMGPWWAKNPTAPVTVHLLPRATLNDCKLLPDWLVELAPDYVIATLGSQVKGTAIWTNLDVVDTIKTAKTTAQQLSESLPRMREKVRWRFVVVTGGSKKMEAGNISELISWRTVPLMLQDCSKDWEGLIRGVTEHVI